jgi:hypothetical protein
MALIPGVTVAANNQDVGGATQLSGAIAMQVHGTNGASQLLLENGLSTAALVSPANSQITFNMAATQEIAVDYSAASADNNAGGVKMNAIPREGGNTFNGTLFVNGTTGALQASNFSDDLQRRVSARPMRFIASTTSIPASAVRSCATSSGSTRRAAARLRRASRRASSTDRNFNNPNAWTWEPDPSRPVSNDSDINDARLHVTWQALPKLKVGGLYVQQTARNWPSVRDANGITAAGTTLYAYEASPYHYFPLERQVTVDAASPVNNNLLIEGAAKHSVERAIRDFACRASARSMVNVLEQSTGRLVPFARNLHQPSELHVLLSGIGLLHHGRPRVQGRRRRHLRPLQRARLRQQPGELPVQQRRAEPGHDARLPGELPRGHQSPVRRLRAGQVDDRPDHAEPRAAVGLVQEQLPAADVGPSPLAPARNFSFSKTEGLSLYDLDPKLRRPPTICSAME